MSPKHFGLTKSKEEHEAISLISRLSEWMKPIIGWKLKGIWIPKVKQRSRGSKNTTRKKTSKLSTQSGSKSKGKNYQCLPKGGKTNSQKAKAISYLSEENKIKRNIQLILATVSLLGAILFMCLGFFSKDRENTFTNEISTIDE